MAVKHSDTRGTTILGASLIGAFFLLVFVCLIQRYKSADSNTPPQDTLALNVTSTVVTDNTVTIFIAIPKNIVQKLDRILVTYSNSSLSHNNKSVKTISSGSIITNNVAVVVLDGLDFTVTNNAIASVYYFDEHDNSKLYSLGPETVMFDVPISRSFLYMFFMILFYALITCCICSCIGGCGFLIGGLINDKKAEERMKAEHREASERIRAAERRAAQAEKQNNQIATKADKQDNGDLDCMWLIIGILFLGLLGSANNNKK